MAPAGLGAFIKEMSKKELARPNKEAMHRLLAKYVNRVEELIFRLAWQAGLTRQEILDLKWSEVSLEEGMIHLPRRSVPIVDELRICLDARRVETAGKHPAFDSPYVIITDGLPRHPTKIHLSRLVAAAIKEEESLCSLRLDDLRNDFIIRILENNPTTYAMEVAGLNRVSINATFADYLPPTSKKVKKAHTSFSSEDKERLLKIIRDEGSSPVAIALQLALELGVPLINMISFTWNQIDFEKKTLLWNGEVYPISEDLAGILCAAFAKRTPGDAPHILLQPRSRRPYDSDRLSKIARNTLIRGGLEHVHVDTLTRASRKSVKPKDLKREKIIAYVREHGSIQNKNVIELLQVSNMTAYRYLAQMAEQGLLVKERQKYYLPKE